MPRKNVLAFAALAVLFMAGKAGAETLELTCTLADTGDRRPLAIDLGTGLVSNGMGYNARRWAARITDSEIAWDEIFDSRIGHVMNHYVLDRSSGALHGTDLTNSSAREIARAVCSRAP
jgi:hypothetical protein